LEASRYGITGIEAAGWSSWPRSRGAGRSSSRTFGVGLSPRVIHKASYYKPRLGTLDALEPW